MTVKSCLFRAVWWCWILGVCNIDETIHVQSWLFLAVKADPCLNHSLPCLEQCGSRAKAFLPIVMCAKKEDGHVAVFACFWIAPAEMQSVCLGEGCVWNTLCHSSAPCFYTVWCFMSYSNYNSCSSNARLAMLAPIFELPSAVLRWNRTVAEERRESQHFWTHHGSAFFVSATGRKTWLNSSKGIKEQCVFL